MKLKLLQLCRYLFGYEIGFVGTGCAQWYYTLYSAISIMFAWRNFPDIASAYTTLVIAEYIIVCIYGYFTLVDYGLAYPITYVLLILVMIVIRFFICWKLAILTSAIGVIGFLMAPDEEGQSIIFHHPEDKTKLALIQNAIFFGLFAYAAIILPVDAGTKVIIILGAMLLHPLVDIADGSCICYSANFMDSIETIIEHFDENKYQKHQSQDSSTKDDTPS